MNTLVLVLHGFVSLADEVPADSDVKAGWGAFAVFVALAVAVGLLGFSLIRHLRKAEANADAGAFGTEAEAEPADRADSPS